MFEICLTRVARPSNAQADHRIVKRVSDSFGKAETACQLVEFAPHRSGFTHAPNNGLCLHVMSYQIKSDPRCGVVFGMPSPLSDVGENGIIGTGVLSQPFFDTAELRRDDAFACQDEGLKCARHSSVSVSKRMDHHQIEMRQCPSDEGGAVVRVFQIFYQFRHQVGDQIMPRSLVHNFIEFFVVNVDGVVSITSGTFLKVMPQHHEMQTSDQRFVEREMCVFGQLLDVCESVPIADYLK